VPRSPAILLTAPGIPQIFMGQLEATTWERVSELAQAALGRFFTLHAVCKLREKTFREKGIFSRQQRSPHQASMDSRLRSPPVPAAASTVRSPIRARRAAMQRGTK
jgi:hypothetical protein